MQSARWTWGGGRAAVLLLGSLAVAQTPAGEIDWRSRAEVPEWSLPASLRAQGGPLLERSLRELGA